MIDEINASSIMTKVKFDSSSWFGIDYNMNLYKGCCHGCIYCDSRSDCYKIDNFDKVRTKRDALLTLRRELKGKRSRGIVGIGAMSDTYNPFEKDLNITRDALKLLAEYRFGVCLDTKSALVTRDSDILSTISQQDSAIVKITITTADDSLSKKIEKNVNPSSERFKALYQLRKKDIYCGILFTPVLPYITDTEANVRQMVHLAKENGAQFIYTYFGVTMRDNQREHYYKHLDLDFPGLKKKYIHDFGNNYHCSSPYKKELHEIFVEECNRANILYKMKDIINTYKKQDCFKQMSLDL